VLNKVDRLADRSYLDVLLKHHPRAVAVSAARGQGIDELREAVMVALSADFADAEIETAAANGRVLAYLAAHAEIYWQEFQGDRVTIRCYLPKHLLHHIQGTDVQVKFLATDDPVGGGGVKEPL
jgi:GTP-binding protein HflX